jgi:hypothetical protein
MDMKSEIVKNLDQPKDLEKLYRENKSAFEAAFASVRSSYESHPIIQAWHERLYYDAITEASKFRSSDIAFVVVSSLIAGALAKIPGWIGMIEEYYYACNFSFIAFPFIAGYFIWKNRTPIQRWWPLALLMLIACIYINLLPMDDESDTYVLACIHLPLFIWTLVGFAFGKCDLRNHDDRIAFLRFNGDLVIMNILLLLSGGLFTGLTLALFSLVNINITTFYVQYIVICGLAASPIISTYLVRSNPSLVNKISPVIAKIFSPLALIALLAYLTLMVATGQDPYTDRDFLIVFNLLLIAVMALVLFASTDSNSRQNNLLGHWVLLLLVATTIIINSIALTAILFRISEWGITPNRLAVLIGNLLVLSNIVLIFINMIGVSKGGREVKDVEFCISKFLPVYTFWTAVVVFLFPVIFGFK